MLERMQKEKVLNDSFTFDIACFALFGVTFLINCLNVIFFKWHIIYLSKDQILYIFSAIAQIVAALISVIIAAYGILDIKNKSKQAEQNEAYKNLRDNLFKALLRIIIIGVVDIALCLLVIATYEEFEGLYDFFSSEAIILLLLLFFNLFNFARYLNPDEIQRAADKILRAMEGEYSDKESDIPIGKFLEDYNNLESTIIQFAMDFSGYKDYYRQIHILDALKILDYNEVTDWQMDKIINDIRRYRNALVHSPEEQKVNREIYDKLSHYLECFKQLFKTYSDLDSEDKREKVLKIRETDVYRALEEYTEQNLLTDLENAICEAYCEEREFTTDDFKKWGVTKELYGFKLAYLKKSGMLDLYIKNNNKTK